jgi:hypothetical protein
VSTGDAVMKTIFIPVFFSRSLALISYLFFCGSAATFTCYLSSGLVSDFFKIEYKTS